MLCVNYLCEPPENLKTISATPLDDWNERLKPFIKDYKLEVSQELRQDFDSEGAISNGLSVSPSVTTLEGGLKGLQPPRNLGVQKGEQKEKQTIHY